MPSQLSGASAVAIQVYQALYGRAPSNALLNAYREQASPNPQQTSAAAASAFAADLASGFSTTSDAALALQVLNNVNITAATVTAPGSYTTLLSALTQAFTGFGPSARGQIILNVTNLLAKLEGDATYGVAATGFNNQAYADFVYGSNANNGSPGVVIPALTSFALGLGVDNIQGTAGDDLIVAAIFAGANSLQSGDKIAGGAGIDRLAADMGSNEGFAVTPETTGVEQVAIRVQGNPFLDTGHNNVSGLGLGIVNIDAQRMVGVNQWESNNSRADLIIEDVRILPNQITKDITIAFVESDPGHVDFGVYFDQLSLRSQSNTTSVLSIEILDTRSAALGTGPLKDNPYDSFAFLINGTPIIVKSAAIDNALTYADLRTAIDAQITVLKATQPLLANFTVTLGPEFTRFDTQSGQAVKGNSIVLTDTGGGVLTVNPTAGFATPSGVVPPNSGLHTAISTVATSSTDKVTAKIILDDVGRGSTSGDLVVGGLSTGASSTSRGVERFEIRVDDNSKLETINSTNNTLQEVVITQGLTTSSSFAYQATVKDKGNLTVNGVSGLNGGNVTVPGLNTVVGGGGAVTANAPFPVTSGAGQSQGIDAQTGSNLPLPGSAAQTARGYGFSDVRLLDGSAMTGQLAFSAEVTGASIAKYFNLRDIGALPAADNIAFVYTGGSNNDAMFMTLDQGVAGSRSTYVSGREDFTFTANGGAGNDNITLIVAQGQLGGAGQAWYTNQKLNANIFVNGGDGNDTIRTPGAGDKIIDGGTGDDTIYTDNSGNQAVTASASAASTAAAASTTAAFAAELAAAIAARTADDATNAATLATAAGNLNALNLVTPVVFAAAPAISHATLQGAIQTAATNKSITLAQQIALDLAYNVATGETITVPTTQVLPAITGTVAVAGNLTAAEAAAGDALLATIIAAAKAAAAAAATADANAITNDLLLNVTQGNVATDTLLMTGLGGTTTKVTNLAALASALVVGATDAQVVAALQAAVANGAITGAPDGTTLQAGSLFTAATSVAPGAIDAAELVALKAGVLGLDTLQNNAAILNTAAAVTLALDTTTNLNAVNVAAAAAAANPAGDGILVGNDAIGSNDTATALANANAALTAANTALTTVSTQAANLAALKAALIVGTTDTAAAIATTNAVANLSITVAQKGLIDAQAIAGAAGIDATEKLNLDLVITGFQLTNETAVALNTGLVANATAVVTATTLANVAAQAANLSGANSLNIAAPRAVFVFDTANQKNVVTNDTGYNLVTNDERNLADLKSDANNTYNLYLAKLKVSFKGIDATVTVDSTGFKTSDLQINQAIKNAINSDPVLSKLLSANDGPANTLVVNSLIDGVMATSDLVLVLTAPAAGTLTASDIVAAATAYGFVGTATEGDLIGGAGFMTLAKAAFDTKADYATQFAETGAAGATANTQIVGRNSLTSSDNTITGGTGNDVIVLSTTAATAVNDPTNLNSSNEKIVFSGTFGNDTIVNFAATGPGIDTLDFKAYFNNLASASFGSLSADKSIVVGAPTALGATVLTTAQIAALFTDSATAINHVYVAVDFTNIGSVYLVADAAGVAAGNVTATLVGSIDLAATAWGSLTAANFA